MEKQKHKNHCFRDCLLNATFVEQLGQLVLRVLLLQLFPRHLWEILFTNDSNDGHPSRPCLRPKRCLRAATLAEKSARRCCFVGEEYFPHVTGRFVWVNCLLWLISCVSPPKRFDLNQTHRTYHNEQKSQYVLWSWHQNVWSVSVLCQADERLAPVTVNDPSLDDLQGICLLSLLVYSLLVFIIISIERFFIF